ncbi:hypothetical protein EJ357_34280 [Streptomyces cyaneochromogenes]|uniref:Uncharacterized protein n=1 Tax=Streptomyces cyaneochromogenes TaxID=2496836 RepID=A0A3Q9EWN9_9ACTN|nr:hypothetical protein [Streptomyces cyaneochromogenes]AZQ37903.1 hypothetical protein EJ357_34280 [Streptomyces cyaneochromogenes]
MLAERALAGGALREEVATRVVVGGALREQAVERALTGGPLSYSVVVTAVVARALMEGMEMTAVVGRPLTDAGMVTAVACRALTDAVQEGVVAGRGAGVDQATASVKRVATSNSLIRADAYSPDRSQGCAPVPRIASTCPANTLDAASLRRSYPIPGVTWRSPSPFT